MLCLYGWILLVRSSFEGIILYILANDVKFPLVSYHALEIIALPYLVTGVWSTWLILRVLIDLKFWIMAFNEPAFVPFGGWGEASAGKNCSDRTSCF